MYQKLLLISYQLHTLDNTIHKMHYEAQQCKGQHSGTIKFQSYKPTTARFQENQQLAEWNRNGRNSKLVITKWSPLQTDTGVTASLLTETEANTKYLQVL